jgi:hypothetical protein
MAPGRCSAQVVLDPPMPVAEALAGATGCPAR